jgi:hypothetical protein
LLLGLATGCSSIASLRYAPPIQDVELRDAAPEARVVVAWRGARERDETPELRFRIRLESLGSSTFTLQAADFELLDAALVPFGPARAETLPLTVAPGQTATFDLAFPVPAGKEPRELDLSAVSLHARFQEGRWSSSTTFQRVVYEPYYDPYWDSPWRFHVGFVWCR